MFSVGLWLYCNVGGIPTHLKNDGVKVSWDDEIPNRWKVISFMFQSPPSSIYLNLFMLYIWVTIQLRHQRSTVFTPCPARLGFHQQALPHGIAERGRTGAAQNLPTAQGLAFGNRAESPPFSRDLWSYWCIYLSIYPSIHPSIHPSIY